MGGRVGLAQPHGSNNTIKLEQFHGSTLVRDALHIRGLGTATNRSEPWQLQLSVTQAAVGMCPSILEQTGSKTCIPQQSLILQSACALSG